MKDEMETNPSCNFVKRADVVREFIKLFGCVQDISDIEEWADVCETTVNEIPSTIVVSRKEYDKVLIECGEVKTKLGELQQTTKVAKGEWIKTVDGNGWDDWYVLKCPFCGATIEDKYYRSWEYNFCPHCGNRVKGSDSE